MTELLEPDPLDEALWWPLGAIDCTLDEKGLRLDDLVYVVPTSHCPPRQILLNILKSVNHNYPGESLLKLANILKTELEAGPNSSKLIVISRSWKVYILLKEQVRPVEADNEWAARLLSLLSTQNPDDKTWNDLEYTLRFAYHARADYLHEMLVQTFRKVQEIIDAVRDCRFSLSPIPSKLLTCVLRCNIASLALRHKLRGSLELNSFDSLAISQAIGSLNIRKIVPEKSLLVYKNVLGLLQRLLADFPWFYLEDDKVLIDHNTLFSPTEEVNKILHQLSMTNASRCRTSEIIPDSLKRFYELEEYRDMQTPNETFLLDVMDPKYDADLSSKTHRHRIMFSTFLRAIANAAYEECKAFCLAFSRFIFLEPSLWLELEDPDFREEFVRLFNQTMQQKEIETTWDELIDTELHPQIDTYLRDYYDYRNKAMASYYFKDKTMCSLLCRPFVSPSEEHCSSKRTVAITPQSCGSPGIALFSENTNVKLVDVAFPDGTTTSLPFVTVCFTDNTSKELPLAFVKTWKCDGKGLEQMIYHMLEKETFEIPKFLYQYIHDVAKANCLFECVVELGRCPMLKHTGVGWFAIIYGLENIEAVKEVFPKYRKKVADAFKDGLNSTLSHGSIIVYYSRLKKYLTEKNRAEIEKAIARRERSEACFNDFVQQIYNYRIDKTFDECMDRHFFVFVVVFLGRYLHLVIKGERESQLEKDIDVFHKILQVFPNFQINFSKEHFRQNMRNAFLNAPRLFPSKKIELLFDNIWPKFHATVLTQFDMSSITCIRPLGDGGSAHVHLARIREYTNEVVAKIFTNQFNLLAHEVSTLLRLQGHTNMVRILGYITKDNEYHGIVMEYCKGGSVMNALEDATFTVDEPQVVSWLYQAASALMFLHKNEIIHRDVKPDNMLLDETKTVLKITDLGITKVLPRTTKTLEERTYERILGEQNNLENVNVSEQRATASGKADGRLSTLGCGTTVYRAPEVEDGPSYTESIDVFSLGRTGWAMINREHPCVESFVDDWPRGQKPAFEPTNRLKNLLRKMMAPSDNDRPSMLQVFDEFENMKNILFSLGGSGEKTEEEQNFVRAFPQNFQAIR